MLMPRKALGGDFAVEFRSDAPHSAYSVASPTPRSDEAEIKVRMHLRKQTTLVLRILSYLIRGRLIRLHPAYTCLPSKMLLQSMYTRH